MAISHTLSQQIIDTIHDVCGYNINFINTQGIISASTNPQRIGSYHEIGHQVALTGQTLEVSCNDAYDGSQEGINIPIFYHQNIIAVIGISAPQAEARAYAHLAERITALLLHEQELSLDRRNRDDQKRYIMRALMSNEVDNRDYLKECLKQFHMPIEEYYRMITFKISSHNPTLNISLLEGALRSFFDHLRQEVYTYFYPDRFIICINSQEFLSYLGSLTQFVEEHPGIKCAIGTKETLMKSYISYQNSLIALAAINDQKIVLFDDLTIEILESEISETTRQTYKEKILGSLKEEEIHFLKVYYDHDMSLNKTAEVLFLHKNTIQQRLNTIAAKTHYNPRHFKEAILFYIALRL